MRATLLALLIGLSGSAHAFTFQVPPGWVDLSPGTPPESFAKLPPSLVKQIQAGNFVFYAADVAHADDGFMENVNASTFPGGEKITKKLLDTLMAQIGDDLTRNIPGAKLTVLETRLVEIGGVTCGRIVALLDGPGVHAKQIQYVLPGEHEAAIVTYTTVPEKFREYEPVFDAAAALTRGITEPRGVAEAAGRGALIGGISGGVAVLLVGLFATLRKRRAR
jgi:hypothetical protein